MSDEAQAQVKSTGSYRPRSHRIEAVLWTGRDFRPDAAPIWMRKIATSWLGRMHEWPPGDRTGTLEVVADGEVMLVGSPRGVLRAHPGDWIVRGPCGGLAVLPAATFAALYEEAPTVP